MITLRPLLRLEDRLRSESRRLAQVGDHPSRRTAAAVWAVAIGLHALALSMPLATTGVALPVRSSRPDLPTVWRLAPPRPVEPVLVAAAAPGGVTVPPSVTSTAPAPGGADTEPVPEPATIPPISLLPADVESLLPEPDESFRGNEPVLAPRTAVTAEPVLRRKVRPTYPAAARALGASGSVTLEVSIREDGSVGFARVVSCSRPALGFEESALLAVREWVYDPAPAGTGVRTATVRTDFQREERP